MRIIIGSTALIAFLGSAALAADMPGPLIELELSATAFEGPPEFAVLANGMVVGGGTVETAIEVGGDNPVDPRTPPAELLRSHSASFQFALPYGMEPQAIEISFINDAWGGEDNPQLDRNLFVLSARIRGKPVDPHALDVPEGAAILDDGTIALYQHVTIALPFPRD